MKKVFILATCLLMAAILLTGCAAKPSRKPVDAGASASGKLNQDTAAAAKYDAGASASEAADTNNQKEEKKTPDAVSTATVSNPNAISEITLDPTKYTAEPANLLEDNWLTSFAGGRDKTMLISIGQLSNHKDSPPLDIYIKLQGKDKEVTLVGNGGYCEYDKSTGKVKRITMNFLTGKKLVGNEVVKEYSDVNGKFILVIDFDKNSAGKPMALFCSEDDNASIPKENYYKLVVQD